ncbi:hypothetical protein ST201phi2-1p317 [Pseudomonas phage 201phi2-1]|uniref:Uncharacterized protein n=1 Tax=Pseudomonas phage 201phi2-1 TaxID=198110 RepID=B3FJH7_BP201|nr:hypothetical protein ST201phi2-1p317 [Pseudomonas phage 201phi2-1]ABY63142.1 hypothetical protein 201phi2-1p317 [Pseudomonas phage 201phi2-1]
MSKPTKFKGNQATFNITFDGIDLTISNVMVKEVDIGSGNHWAMLERRGDRWMLLTTPGYLIEPLVDQQQTLEFDRTDVDRPVLVNGHMERLPITVHTALNISESKLFYSIDECSTGTRLQYNSNLFNGAEHDAIKHIVFDKVVK